MNEFAAFAGSVAAVLALAVSPATATDPAGVTVDIQVSLCGAPAEIVKALKLKSRGSPLDVWLFDDPALSLFAKAGSA